MTHHDRRIEPRPAFTVRLDRWDRMMASLLEQVLADAGSVRAATRAVEMPRSTFGAWVQRYRRRARR